jgi:hypothetical protein
MKYRTRKNAPAPTATTAVEEIAMAGPGDERPPDPACTPDAAKIRHTAMDRNDDMRMGMGEIRIVGNIPKSVGEKRQ